MVKLSPMKPSLQKLHKFLKLEADRGYDNRAVLGGLERILNPWEAEARADELPEELIQVIFSGLRDYPQLSPGQRANTLQSLWQKVQEEEDVPQETFAPPKNEQGPIKVEKEREAPVELPASKASNASNEGINPTKPINQQLRNRKPIPPEIEKPSTPAALNASITVLAGIGPRYAQILSRLGLTTLEDMLYFFPRRYDDYTKLKPINRLFYGEEVTVIGTVQNTNIRKYRGGNTQVVESLISDGSGILRASWFNQVWLAKRLQPGMHVVLSGKVDQFLGRLVINNPEWEPLEQENLHTNRIVPVYPLTANITQRWLRRQMFQVVSYWSQKVPDPLPESLRKEAGLAELGFSLLQMHFPDSWDQLIAARYRLAFEEILLLQLGVLRQKRYWQEREGRIFRAVENWITSKVERLPFTLTNAQQRALEYILNDLSSGRPMNRLLQGDVGSGKTVIAGLAMSLIASQGSQAALMAPTSILAEQHHQSLIQMLTGEQGEIQPDQIRLMIGATPEPEKHEIREGLASGAIKIIVGTHSLIEDPVTFFDLQLVVVDEQHRFGVDQRAALRSKGPNPHLLVMTATPIPRSLALTVYGDLDLTVMDEMPPGRQPVETHTLFPNERERAYTLIRSQVEQGHQAFIIYPLIEESERTESKAAVEEYHRLQKEIFPDLKVGLLHGRLRGEEKDAIMALFRDRKLDILVSTSVVEVGVDIPNASVMIVEGANRFGLAQLHQLRGRVGRNQDQAYCLLIPEDPDAVENERLAAMVETNDGFVLAERDLEQRGPGEFLGTRQSGYSQLRLASLADVRLIENARQHAHVLFERDPDLILPEHKRLAAALSHFWGDRNGDIS